ncbi:MULTISPECIES: MFS transporter [unclassified Shewanella]|uniref:MFS transporter n=1 Tax=unclassified Shewanella TaxID=196818 RepID=UPI000C81E57F|nr:MULTISPECIES: MFS transporter [unclassified Shewanella]MDO6618751.1 MFS transporter [Shewanella sp. 6_MG-2023]MDO6639806.1 MFS transporter [Shewanella sp. 5_MG-2023]MDO6775499.1 MFS transporter [Shewanella sp. 3_MG-2023]PMG42745.1 MFS transporter [Shewanella sp. 10N.286.52.B9]PMH85268.1 MFS transporter [Shewanella sp. 10N.286.48.B5]
MANNGLSGIEKKVAFSLASVFGLRMMGLFMIMPVFALYGQHLEGFSPLWVGIAIGAYGLTQAVLQIPMGMLSDKYGRKPIILAGLVVFAIGSVVAAMSDHIYGVVLGRAIQGMGAIAAAVLALAADLTRDEQRTKVMAIIGMCIGFSFALSLLAGPIVAQYAGLEGLFFLTAILAVVGMIIVQVLVPNPVSQAPKGDTVATPTKLKRMLMDPQLFRLDAGIFILHLVLTAVFVALPLDLVDAGLVKEKHWMLYFPAFIGAFFLMVPLIIIGVKRNNTKTMFQISLMIMMLALAAMGSYADNLWVLSAAVVLFFTGFNYLEASLPSLIAKFCPVGDKGSAMGVYSTSQFLGAFCGGMLGGGAYQLVGAAGVFYVALGLMFIWLLLTIGMEKPVLLKSYTLEAQVKDRNQAKDMATQLSQLSGVAEAIVVMEERAAYLKVDDQFDLSEARAVLGSVN